MHSNSLLRYILIPSHPNACLFITHVTRLHSTVSIVITIHPIHHIFNHPCLGLDAPNTHPIYIIFSLPIILCLRTSTVHPILHSIHHIFNHPCLGLDALDTVFTDMQSAKTSHHQRTDPSASNNNNTNRTAPTKKAPDDDFMDFLMDDSNF